MALVTYQGTSAQGNHKHFQHTLETTATAAEIWRIWTDVDHWAAWDTGLQQATLAGSFEEGTKGTLISDQGRKAKFMVTAVDEGVSYTFKTRLPLGRLQITRSLREQNGTVLFTHEVRFRGLTGGLFARMLGKAYREMLPKVMQNIQRQAEGQ